HRGGAARICELPAGPGDPRAPGRLRDPGGARVGSAAGRRRLPRGLLPGVEGRGAALLLDGKLTGLRYNKLVSEPAAIQEGFRQSGFVTLPDLIDRDKLPALREATERLVERCRSGVHPWVRRSPGWEDTWGE